MGWLIGLPRWAQGLGALAIAAAAFVLWLHFHDRGVIAGHEADLALQVQASASAAAGAAAVAVTETRTETEKANARARDAAARSDDSLKSAFDSLRAGEGAADAGPR